MARSFATRFRIEAGKRALLSRRDPGDLKAFPNRKAAEKQSKEDGKAIDKLQDRLYAEGKRALLVVLQGTDTGGKDGTIKHVFKEAGPLGVVVTAFKRPSEEELAHDFLWRAHIAAPRRGYIGIFNRSHYEDVLIGRVRELAPKVAIEKRYGQINAFEKILAENGTRILKFMLHISKEEQRERLQARLDEAKSRWKFNPSDLDDRKLWDKFIAAYELMLDRCSTEWAPWHVIPADHKWARNAAIAAIVRETLEEMNPQYPKPTWGLEGLPDRLNGMKRKTVTVSDKMQKRYRYTLSAPVGHSFDPEFKPDLTPAEMLRLGVFCGKYMTDCRKEFPASWFRHAKLARKGRDCSLNFFGVDASQPLSVWRKKGWLREDDPRGWFQWYCRYYMGRRMPEEDRRQIGRWKAIRRHVRQVQKNCEPGDLFCRPRQRQALLHWAYDSRKL